MVNELKILLKHLETKKYQDICQGIIADLYCNVFYNYPTFEY